jgi:hypothetical protein
MKDWAWRAHRGISLFFEGEKAISTKRFIPAGPQVLMSITIHANERKKDSIMSFKKP